MTETAETRQERRGLFSVWLLATLCIAVLIASVAFGTAYTGIRQARTSAAKASLGYIENVFQMAELQAGEGGLAPSGEAFQNLLTSYDHTATLSPYEQAVLDYMLDHFGPDRDFDFALIRYQDSNGYHTQVYFFPELGRTNLRRDSYFSMIDGHLV